MCTLDGINAEHKFRVWVIILGRMSRHISLSLFHFHVAAGGSRVPFGDGHTQDIAWKYPTIFKARFEGGTIGKSS